MKKILLFVLAAVLLPLFAGTTLYADAAATATQCVVNAQATATAEANNIIATATAVHTPDFVPTMTYVATLGIIEMQTNVAICNSIASYTPTSTVTPSVTPTFTATPSATKTITPTFTITPTATQNFRGPLYFQPTPQSGKVKIFPSTSLNAAKMVDKIYIDYIANTNTSVSIVKIYNGTVLLKQVEMSGRKFPRLIDMAGIRADNLYIDYGTNTGTSTVKTQ